MSIRTRLLLAMGLGTALLLIPAIYAASQLDELRDIAFEQRGRHAAAFLALGRLQAAVAELDRLERSYIIAPDPELRAGVRRSIAEVRTQLSLLGRARYGEIAREAGARLDSLEEATLRIERLVESGRLEEATAAFEGVKPLLAGFEEELNRIARAIDRRSIAQLAEAQGISETAARTTRMFAVISLLLAGGVGIWTTGTLTAPLLRLRREMARVAAGKFVVPRNLPYERRDEIGDLMRSFRWMTAKLAELERIRTEFVGIVTHDLKVPINVIGGYAELLEEGIYGDLNDKQREVIESIREQTRVLTGMVNQLLDLSRIEAGGLTIEKEEVELRELFDSVERAFRALAEREGIDFRIELAPSLPARMLADSDRLRDQVLGNLLSNAFKFTPSGGRVRVRAWGEDDAVHIEVSDTGPGLPPDQIPHIFDKYYQVTPEARARGAGLGLAIVKEVVEAHGGRIWAESEPGRGTTFHILLPVGRPGAGGARQGRAADSGPAGSRAADGGAPVEGERDRRSGRAEGGASARHGAPSSTGERGVLQDGCAGCELFRELAEHIGEVLWMTSPDKREMLYVNPRFEETWGRSREELYARPRAWLDAVHPEDRARIMASLPKQIAGEYDEEYRIVRPDGSIRWIRARAFPLRDESGRVYRIAGISEDITDRKRAEESARRLVAEQAARAAAEEAEQRSRFLAEAGAILASSLDYETTLRRIVRLSQPILADWSIVDIVENGQVRRIASTHGDPAKATALRELERHYPLDPASDSPGARALRTGEPELANEVSADEFIASTRDERFRELMHSLRPESYIAVPIVSRGRALGAITLVASESGRRYEPADLVLAEDLATRAALAIDNARLYEAATAASRAKSDFLAVMSHELRTPLAAITGYADLIETGVAGEVTPKQVDMLKRIRANATRQLRIIEQILAFSRMEAGREKMHLEWRDLAELVRDAADAVGAEAEEKGLDLEVRIPEGPIPVETDGGKVYHIIVDLLSNAVKFTERGEIELTGGVQNGEIVVRVRDTGVGIPAEHRERIFEPFFQIEEALTREKGGTGLGLAVARRLALLMGGDVTVDSEPGKGSTFELRLPARVGQRAAD